MKIQRQFNPKYKGHPGVIIPGKSCTVPDQSLSLETLLKNHTRGIPSNTQMQEPIYTEGEVPNMHMDLNELADLRYNNAKKAKELEQKAKDEIEEAKELRNAIAASKANQQKTKVDESKQPGMENDGGKKGVENHTQKP